nr:probable endopeptidase P60 [Ipomoea batatas]
MWNKRGPADDSAGDGDDREKAIAKTAGFVVFSGIAMSIIKALNPFNNNPSLKNGDTESTQPQVLKQWQQPQELPPPPPPPQPPSEPIVTKSTCCSEQNAVEPSPKVIEIVRGDTLWGLSREYGVSIEAIKEANDLKGDTIYAGKKLVIP